MVEPGGPGAVEAVWMQQLHPAPAEAVVPPPHQPEGALAGGDNPAAPHVAPADHHEAPVRHNGLGAAHQAMLQGGGPTGYQPYKMPSVFYLRVRICEDLGWGGGDVA